MTQNGPEILATFRENAAKNLASLTGIEIVALTAEGLVATMPVDDRTLSRLGF